MSRVPGIAAVFMIAVLAPVSNSLSAQLPAVSHDPPSVMLPASLERVLRDYEAAWQQRSAARVAALFSADGFALPSGRPPARGRAAIAATYAGSGGALQLRALAYDTSATLGHIIGAYGYGPKPPVADEGKFVLVMRRDTSGRWMIVADMDNSSMQ